ncbi:hypothetical protein COCMIDRAFT_101029 [Bipolaris oryzae ATCC 44560]|uniref:Uncharacterized protein n=1 Tax=Bipolaris oryzae ATCC 44560 TaxID=930090 RepID=W6Z0C7_COCMI|nr:uncharacterized protein COCMIDRAFT_101029 [Bipolaris oryzae ATCC 44560]EUC43365.1 hypothetical protein COCMIDRAFT_101029 [Bipolaris oryzae ATCC 44560]
MTGQYETTIQLANETKRCLEAKEGEMQKLADALAEKLESKCQSLELQSREMVHRSQVERASDKIQRSQEMCKDISDKRNDLEQKIRDMVDRVVYDAVYQQSEASTKKLLEAGRELAHVRERLQFNAEVLEDALHDKETLSERIRVSEEERLAESDMLQNYTAYIEQLPSLEECTQTSNMLRESQVMIASQEEEISMLGEGIKDLAQCLDSHMATSINIMRKFLEVLAIKQNELEEVTEARDTMAAMAHAFKVGVDEMNRKS